LQCYAAKKDDSGTNIWVLNNTNESKNIEFSKTQNNQVKLENGYKIVYQEFNLENPTSYLDAIDINKNYIKESKELANNFIKNLQNQKKLIVNSNVNNGYLLLLHQVGVPSFIAFLGNVNNENDMTSLNDKNSKINIANAISNAIIQYKKEIFDRKFEPIDEDSLKKLTLKELSIVQNTGIFFDYGKSYLTDEDYFKLDKIVLLLKKHDHLNLEINCHSDARSNDEFNLKLSEKRAITLSNYLVGRGISKERIIAIGRGESQILNSCKNGVKCSEEEHKVNRRIEFILKQQ
jgi:outer membrane protein OmpA-like peptidoglycan-associated protein